MIRFVDSSLVMAYFVASTVDLISRTIISRLSRGK